MVRFKKIADSLQAGGVSFWLMHVACLAAFYTGVTWSALAVCLAMFWLRMFGVTAGYHRYFAHRSYKTGRAFQLCLAVLGTLAVQKGVLWWAGHHRTHHKYSDQEGDIHSPTRRGFWWSHAGWILARDYEFTDFDRIRDMAKYPELRWLNDHYLVPPVALAVLLYLLGGLPWLVWGFVISTVVLWHATFTINSLSHVYGSRRYDTTDTSRNNVWLALLTMGEGWHNNHHHYMNACRQGFFWWEIDASYYILRALSWFGVVWDLHEPPERVLRPAANGAPAPPAAAPALALDEPW